MHIYTSLHQTKHLDHLFHACYLLPCPFSLKERALHMKMSYQWTIEKTTDYLLQKLQQFLLCHQGVTPCAARMYCWQVNPHLTKKGFLQKAGSMPRTHSLWVLLKTRKLDVKITLSLIFELFLTITMPEKRKEVLRTVWIQAFCHAKWIHSVVTWLIYVPAGYSLEIT